MQNSCLKTSAWWSRSSHFVENGYPSLRFPNMVKMNIHKHWTRVTRFNPLWVSGCTNSLSLVTYVENFASKVEVWSLSDGKNGSRVRLCFRVVDDVPEKKGMDLWKQMSSSKCSFTCICGIFLPLNPSTTTVYAWSAFYPSLRFTLSLQSAFYTQSAFYPWSAVCSPQSAVFVLHWPIPNFLSYNLYFRLRLFESDSLSTKQYTHIVSLAT